MNILGIETSCDETAAAVVTDGTIIRSSVVASSTEMHRKYGGIVPEVAAREQLKVIIPTLSEAITQAKVSSKEIDAIAVTQGPGLIGSLLVGVEAAKTLAVAWNKPIIPINHVIAHMYANFVQNAQSKFEIEYPAISLVVSGGHTEIFLMRDAQTLKWLGGTVDDAAGEAFDKAARLLGFENRGGPAIEVAASKFQISNLKFQIKLPRPLLHDETLNFSFSGLKTAILREYNHLKELEQLTNETINYFAHEVQEAITDVLVKKTLKAAELHNAKSILVSGGVAANKRLIEKFQISNFKFKIFNPPPVLCTDNAVSIATCAFFQNHPIPWKQITAQPNLSVELSI